MQLISMQICVKWETAPIVAWLNLSAVLYNYGVSRKAFVLVGFRL